MKVPPLMPGDLILSTTKTPLSWTIRQFGKMAGNKGRVSHAALSLGEFYQDEKIIEALWRVKISDLSKYDNQAIIVYRLKGFGMDVREMVVEDAIDRAGKDYGITKIPLFAADAIATSLGKLVTFGHSKPIYFFTQKMGIMNWQVCSNFWAYEWDKFGGFKLPVGWRAASPTYLDDFFWNRPDLASIPFVSPEFQAQHGVAFRSRD